MGWYFNKNDKNVLRIIDITLENDIWGSYKWWCLSRWLEERLKDSDGFDESLYAHNEQSGYLQMYLTFSNL